MFFCWFLIPPAWNILPHVDSPPTSFSGEYTVHPHGGWTVTPNFPTTSRNCAEGKKRCSKLKVKKTVEHKTSWVAAISWFSNKISQEKKRSLGDCHVLLPRWIYILKSRRHIQAAQPNLHLVNKHLLVGAANLRYIYIYMNAFLNWVACVYLHMYVHMQKKHKSIYI